MSGADMQLSQYNFEQCFGTRTTQVSSPLSTCAPAMRFPALIYAMLRPGRLVQSIWHHNAARSRLRRVFGYSICVWSDRVRENIHNLRKAREHHQAWKRGRVGWDCQSLASGCGSLSPLPGPDAQHTHTNAHQRDGLQFKVRASCVEIYNESVIDLVKYSRQSKGVETLPVKFDTSRGSFFVHDLSYGKVRLLPANA
eukprot:2831553-Rhodomonas_salina.2